MQTKDFLSDPIKINASGDVLIEEKDGHQTFYFVDEESFLISILESPFAKVRKKAEEDFLEKLGIGRAQACRLQVSVTTPLFVNPDEAGKKYGLSFCE